VGGPVNEGEEFGGDVSLLVVCKRRRREEDK
jgi:hypothetical protein